MIRFRLDVNTLPVSAITAAVLAKLQAAIHASAPEIVRMARSQMPVRSGRLRRSVTGHVAPDAGGSALAVTATFYFRLHPRWPRIKRSIHDQMAAILRRNIELAFQGGN